MKQQEDNPSVLDRAIELIKGLDKVSAVTLQRQSRITWTSAGKILDEMIQRRLIGAKKDEHGFHNVKKIRT